MKKAFLILFVILSVFSFGIAFGGTQGNCGSGNCGDDIDVIVSPTSIMQIHQPITQAVNVGDTILTTGPTTMMANPMQSTTVINKTERPLPDTPQVPNVYVNMSTERIVYDATKMFGKLPIPSIKETDTKLGVYIVRYDEEGWIFIKDKLNYNEVLPVFFAEYPKRVRVWDEGCVAYEIIGHPRVFGTGLNVTGVVTALSPSSGGTGGGMTGFTRGGERDIYEIYFYRIDKEVK